MIEYDPVASQGVTSARSCPGAEIGIDRNASPKAAGKPQTHSEAPFTTSIQLDGKSSVPSRFLLAGTFTVVCLKSPAGLPERITKLSPVPATLVSVSLKSLPASRYQVWASEKLLPSSMVHPFRTNVMDFDSQPMCWAGCEFDYVHYSLPRKILNDIAEDFGVGQVRDYRRVGACIEIVCFTQAHGQFCLTAFEPLSYFAIADPIGSGCWDEYRGRTGQTKLI